VKLNIPYYAQSSEFSCGPACVLMIFKFFKAGLKLNRTLEFEVWRQCNMIGVRATDPFGLSVPLLDAGLDIHVLTQHRSMIDPDFWKRKRRGQRIPPEDGELAVFGIAENRKRALGRGLKVKYGPLSVERVTSSFHEGFIPVALVHMGVVHQLNIPHWVVVTDAGDDQVTFNDPYPPKGGKNIRVSRKEFQKMLSHVGTRTGLSPSVVFVRIPPEHLRTRTRINQSPIF
jgi:hypothetical protein